MFVNKWTNCINQAPTSRLFSGILTDGIRGQSPVHFSLPTSQINTSLVFSAVWHQHQLPLPTPGLLNTEDFHWLTNPLVSHRCNTNAGQLLCAAQAPLSYQYLSPFAFCALSLLLSSS